MPGQQAGGLRRERDLPGQWITHLEQSHLQETPIRSWVPEPCRAVHSSLPPTSEYMQHALGGPIQHRPGQEEVPREPPLCFSQVNRVRVPLGGTGTLVLKMSLPRRVSSTSWDPPWLPHHSQHTLFPPQQQLEKSGSPAPSFRQVPGAPDALLRLRHQNWPNTPRKWTLSQQEEVLGAIVGGRVLGRT